MIFFTYDRVIYKTFRHGVRSSCGIHTGRYWQCIVDICQARHKAKAIAMFHRAERPKSIHWPGVHLFQRNLLRFSDSASHRVTTWFHEANLTIPIPEDSRSAKVLSGISLSYRDQTTAVSAYLTCRARMSVGCGCQDKSEVADHDP